MEDLILEKEFYFGIDNENTHGEEGLLCIGIDNRGMPDDELEGTFEELIEYIKNGDLVTKIDLNLADEDTEENRKTITAFFLERLPLVELEIN